jgi:hypothetical protein
MKDESAKRSRSISARVPEELASRIEELATENTRTVSLQVEHLLKLALDLVDRAHGVDNVRIVRETYRTYDKKGK